MANIVNTTIDIECGNCIMASTFLPPPAPLPPRKRVDLSHEGRGGSLRLAKNSYASGCPLLPLWEKVPVGRKRGERSSNPWLM